MKCPKCGFDQPKDRFCAQCGVDVSLYRAKVATHFLLSKTFLVAMSATIGCGLIVFTMVRMKESSDIARPDVGAGISAKKQPTPNPASATARSQPDQNPVPTSAPQPEEVSENTTDTADATGPQAFVAAGTEPSLNAAPQAEPTSIASPSSAAATAPSNWTPTGFRLSFYEISFDQFQASLGIGGTEQTSMGLVRFDTGQNNVQDKFKTLISSGAIERHAVLQQKISFDEQNPNEFNFLSYDQRISSEIGLSMQIRVNPPTDGNMNISIEGRRLIGKEGSPQVDVLPFSRDLTLNAKSAAYITGLIENRNPLDQSEFQSFMSNQFLNIYRSERFRNKQTGLVIILETESTAR